MLVTLAASPPPAPPAATASAGPRLTALRLAAAPGSAEPHLAPAPGGGYWMSWLEPAGGISHALRVARLGASGRVPPPSTVAASDRFFVNWADFPSVVPFSGGKLAAHWLQKSGPGAYAYDVNIAVSGDGGATWRAPVVPHRDGTQTEHGFVSLVARPGGGFHAFWLDGRKMKPETPGAPAAHDDHGSGEMSLAHALFDANGTAREEEMLDGRVCECCQTSAAMTSAGAVVVYRDRSPENVRDIAIVRAAGKGWSEPVRVAADEWRIDACPVNGPAIAAAGRDVVVAWYTGAGQARVSVAFSGDAGASFAEPIRVDDGDPVGRVDVEMLPGGKGAVATWVERAGAAVEVRARRVDANGAMGRAFRVGSSSDARAAGFPRTAIDQKRIAWAWTQPATPPRLHAVTAELADLGAGGGRSASASAAAAAAPAFSARALDGTQVKLGEGESGPPVLVNVWATWCIPCRTELPELQAISNDNRGIRVIGISVDAAKAEPQVRALVAEKQVTYPILLDPGDRASSLFRVTAYPTTILLGSNGREVWRHVGPLRRDDAGLRKAIERALAPPATAPVAP